MSAAAKTTAKPRTRRTAFARWIEAQGLSTARAAEALGISYEHARHLRAGHRRDAARTKVKPSKTERLAMAAISAGLAPWGDKKN